MSTVCVHVLVGLFNEKERASDSVCTGVVQGDWERSVSRLFGSVSVSPVELNSGGPSNSHINKNIAVFGRVSISKQEGK
jgi:hypothetical protein